MTRLIIADHREIIAGPITPAYIHAALHFAASLRPWGKGGVGEGGGNEKRTATRTQNRSSVDNQRFPRLVRAAF